MTVEFSDANQIDAHSLFQEWRLANPDGFFLTDRGSQVFALHYVGCFHFGHPFWRPEDANNAHGTPESLTRRLKVCSNRPDDLATWLHARGLSPSLCQHCVTRDADNQIRCAPGAKQKMESWLEEAHELLDDLEIDSQGRLLAEELEDARLLVEGAVRSVQVNAYERNPEARRRCIEHYGARCVICGFSFGQFYGSTFEGFIHVHHIRALASIRGAYEVDPIADLRPVCPNCHAVIHSTNPACSIEDVQQKLRRVDGGSSS